jgi:hypothetical protein
MGQSTDAKLVFGIQLDEDTELPWRTELDDDIDEWWTKVTGFVASFLPYDENGSYAAGVTPKDPRITAYHEELKAWLDAHPLPIELCDHCSGDFPMFVVSVPGAVLTAHRGYPVKVDALPAAPNSPERILEFIRQYIDPEFPNTEPAWWLRSMWS